MAIYYIWYLIEISVNICLILLLIFIGTNIATAMIRKSYKFPAGALEAAFHFKHDEESKLS
jgi:hypothetical protein